MKVKTIDKTNLKASFFKVCLLAMAIFSSFSWAMACTAPTGLLLGTTTLTCNSFDVKFLPVIGATYEIEVTGPGAPPIRTTSFVAGNVFSGLTSDATYSVRVRSLIASTSCVSPWSAASTITTVGSAPIVFVPPTFLKCNSVRVTWGALNMVSSCQITVKNVATNTIVYNNSSYSFGLLSINLTSLTPSTTYSFSITTNTACPANTTVNFTTAGLPSAPTSTSATNRSCNGFRANWNIVSGATGYFIDVATSPSFGSGTILQNYNYLYVANGNSSFLDITGLAVDQTYYYRVSSAHECISAYSNVVTVDAILKAPIAASATNILCTNFIANWLVVPGATGYYIDVATNSSFASNTIVAGYNNLHIAGGSTNNLPIVGLSQGQTYYYRVSVQNVCGIAYSNIITVVTNTTNCCDLPAPIYFLSIAGTNNTCNSFEFGWSPVIGADGYYLDIALDANFTTFVPNYQNRQIVGNTYNTITMVDFGPMNSMIVNTNLTPSTTYYMRIRAYSSTCGVSYIYGLNVATTYGAPTVSATSIKCNSAIISWGGVANHTGWQVVVTNLATSTVVYSNNNYPIAGGPLSLGGLTPSTNYSASITPITPSPACQLNRTINFTTASLLLAPTASAATNNSCGFRANWNVVSGATGYYIDVATDPSFANNNFVSGYNNRYIANGNSNFLDIPGLLVGQTYYYRVRSANECVSSNSNVVSVTVNIGAPVTLRPNDLTCNSFLARWTSVACADGYILEVSLDPYFMDITTFNVSQATNPSYLVDGLSPSTTYYLRVFSYDQGQTFSDPSNERIVVTDAPSTTCGLRIIKDAPITYGYQDKNGMEENQISQNINNGKSNGGKSNLTIGINFEVSPNPTASTISFTCESNEPMVYQLMDVQGKLLQNDKIVSGANISLDAYSKGIYVLRVLSSDGTLLGNKRIIKQ